MNLEAWGMLWNYLGSALDNETESKIMNEVYKIGKNKTVLIVAHRLSTLEGCDRIVRFEDGEMR